MIEVPSYNSTEDSLLALSNEIKSINNMLADPSIKIPSDVKAEKRARLLVLQSQMQKQDAKLKWGAEFGFEKIESASDFYEYCSKVKEGLKLDVELQQPVFTAEEREIMVRNLTKRENEIRKANPWYKRVAWGPSIALTVIMNAILP